MDESLPIRIVRDVVNRCGLSALRGVYATTKPDGSRVTDIDPLVEAIVIEHLRSSLDDRDFMLVAEESSGPRLPTIAQLKTAKTVVTVDGIDGTGDFIRHYNSREPNPKWLLALSAVYKISNSGALKPILAFAYQPDEDRMFVFLNEKALLIEKPCGRARMFELNVANLAVQTRARGSKDVFLDKPSSDYQLENSLVAQSGPSGFNMASLAASCAPFYPARGTTAVNFTTFHYNLWDFGLWPVLNSAGFKTYKHDGQQVTEPIVDWFRSDGDKPGRIQQPLIICMPAHKESILAGMKRTR